jgi:hypothetical protein
MDGSWMEKRPREMTVSHRGNGNPGHNSMDAGKMVLVGEYVLHGEHLYVWYGAGIPILFLHHMLLKNMPCRSNFTAGPKSGQIGPFCCFPLLYVLPRGLARVLILHRSLESSRGRVHPPHIQRLTGQLSGAAFPETWITVLYLQSLEMERMRRWRYNSIIVISASSR